MGKSSQVIGTMVPDNLIADNIHPIDTEAVTIAVGAKTLLRGTLINATGDMCTLSSDVPVGILCEDVVQDQSETTQALMYITGSFSADEIKVGESVNVADYKVALKNLGIFVK